MLSKIYMMMRSISMNLVGLHASLLQFMTFDSFNNKKKDNDISMMPINSKQTNKQPNK